MSQQSWERCLHKAAKSGFTVAQAVVLWQKLEHTKAWPSSVAPQPLPSQGGRLVADLWPKFRERPWLAK